MDTFVYALPAILDSNSYDSSSNIRFIIANAAALGAQNSMISYDQVGNELQFRDLQKYLPSEDLSLHLAI